jgi:SAM-dependent methyltransferase
MRAHRWMPGASWQNPVVNGALRLLDPVDALARKSRGLSDLPPYSIRVRSNGVRGQFGGAVFAERGAHFVELLRTQAGLRPDSRVLEIGCGCGRIAIALARYLEGGSYTGLDIDPVVIRACANNAALRSRSFTFRLLPVQNEEYNRAGSDRAESFRFRTQTAASTPCSVSVFTHMLPAATPATPSRSGASWCPAGTCFHSVPLDHARVGPRRAAFDRGAYHQIHPTRAGEGRRFEGLRSSGEEPSRAPLARGAPRLGAGTTPSASDHFPGLPRPRADRRPDAEAAKLVASAKRWSARVLAEHLWPVKRSAGARSSARTSAPVDRDPQQLASAGRIRPRCGKRLRPPRPAVEAICGASTRTAPMASTSGGFDATDGVSGT